MRKNRSENRIIFDVLVFVEKEECSLSSILRNVNLPHSKFKEIEEYLIKRDLIEKVVKSDRVFFRITDKGRELLTEYRKFKELLEMYGLEP